jgi:hypothetical protein
MRATPKSNRLLYPEPESAAEIGAQMESVVEEDARNYLPERPGCLFFIGWIVAAMIAIALTTGLVMARAARLTDQAAQIETQ